MSHPTFLLDTNIFIPLEDNREVLVEYQTLQSNSAQHGLRLCVHEAIKRDIARDKDAARRAISLTKVGKFFQLTGIHLPDRNELEVKYGKIADDNDLVDVELLHAVSIGAVDFLITNDEGIHTRAKVAGIASAVLRVGDALAWIDLSFGRSAVELPFVRDAQAHQLNFADPIFQSVRLDYVDFDGWARKCLREQRRAWIIERDGEYAAVAIVKEEGPPPDADVDLGVKKILKLCLFKVSERHAGLRLGELLLKKALRYAKKNAFEAVYLTAFPKHTSLIELAESVGFGVAGRKGGELIVAKKLVGDPPRGVSLVDAQRFRFPAFQDDASVRKILLPITARYHLRLFPETSSRSAPDLLDAIQSQAGEDATPGNTFRKVYVTHSRMNQVAAGDLLLFYVMKNDELSVSQEITYAGVVEAVHHASDIESLVRLTAKRTAYLRSELDELLGKPGGVKVIEFLAIGALKPPMSLSEAKTLGILSGPPQSLMTLPDMRYEILKKHSAVRF